MKRFFGAIKRFFSPSPESSALIKIAPYIVVAFLMVILFVFATYTWEATNQVKFCGLTCHTMPPEYVTQQKSPHANVSCEDCHMGRDSLAVLLPRKIQYSWQTGSAMVFGTFKYPIVAKNMRPARDACENCHDPNKFSSDAMVTLKHFADDKANTLTTTYLLLKVGGGTQRQGLGFGIHWHVENPVYFYATDPEKQNIPYVKVTRVDGSTAEYVDSEANLDPKSIDPKQLQVMDCITCHNRTAHDIPAPSQTMDNLIGRGLISQTIPDIHKKGVEVLSAKYDSEQAAFDGIQKLYDYYLKNYPDFYANNTPLVKAAVDEITQAYADSVFPDQQVDMNTHPNNIGHMQSAGCFRCHDGKHVTADGKDTVRLECNLCHTIPVVSRTSQLVTNLPVEKGVEPDTHKNPNWINIHRSSFDNTCQACHTVDDAGGTSNKSFCSNSICHSSVIKYVGLDAPKLKEMIKSQIPTPAPTLIPSATPTTAATSASTAQATPPAAATSTAGGAVTFAQIGPIFTAKCKACHGDSTAIKDLSLSSYAKVMAGGSDGPVVQPGKPDDSLLVQKQSTGNHPGQLSADELDLVKKWITAGAPEK